MAVIGATCVTRAINVAGVVVRKPAPALCGGRAMDRMAVMCLFTCFCIGMHA